MQYIQAGQFPDQGVGRRRQEAELSGYGASPPRRRRSGGCPGSYRRACACGCRSRCARRGGVGGCGGGHLGDTAGARLQVEEEVWKILEKIDAMGGAVKAIERGYMQQEISRSAYQEQQDVEAGKKVIVGVNKFVEEEEAVEGGMGFDPTVEERQLANLKAVKKERDNQKVQAALDQIRRAAEGKDNLMFPIIEAVKVQATIGEICRVLRGVFGEYQPYTQL